jgi:hypothetical protein
LIFGTVIAIWPNVVVREAFVWERLRAAALATRARAQVSP